MIQRQNCGLGQDRPTSGQHSQWKRKLRFGTWNIKTINGKEIELIQEMKDRKIEIYGRGRPRITWEDGIQSIGQKKVRRRKA